MLVTSRAPLKIRAEHEYPVRPLALPDLRQVPTLHDVAQASSVRLFLARAQAAVPGFALTPSNYVAVAAICRRLDGLPLALELVAARVRVLSPTELLARFDHVLPLLVGGSRDLPQRQQTMRAAINWSHELLSRVEQAFFCRLSVFAGGWTLDAAEAVTAWEEIAVEDVIELLSDLVEQSLVMKDGDTDDVTRYRMLEPIRQFAARRVRELGESVELADRHLAWCLSLVQRAVPELLGPAQQQWLDHLEREHDNLRVALAWSEEDGSRTARGLQLATGLWRFWETRGHLTEGRRWLEQALSAGGDVPVELRADALNAAGNLARDQGDYAQAIVLQEAGLELRRDLGDADGIAKSLNDLGNALLEQGDYERATMLYEEALSLFRNLQADWGIAIALGNLGIVLGYRGDYQRAAARLEEALVLWERLGETALRARALDALGVVMQRQGDLARAGTLHVESLALRRQLGDTRGIALSLNHLGLVARYQGDHRGAARLIDEALQLRRAIGARSGVAASLSALAAVARLEGDTQMALSLYRDALTMQHQMGINEGIVDCLLGLSAIAAGISDAERAARLLGASEMLRETMNLSVAPVDRADYERIVAAIRESLPDDIFARARATGRAMTLDRAVSDALNSHEGVS
jgi:predicted ATPase/Tfp pilus assembly protein PilF